MTTPDERTQAIVDAPTFLRTLAAADQVTIPALVLTAAGALRRHYHGDGDLELSASGLPAIRARPHTRQK